MATFLARILEYIHDLVGSYGWAIIIFTFTIKLLLTPLDYKSRKGMKQMEKLQPELVALQQKYANDKEKLNKKTTELYQREKINPMSGCMPMLFSMVILFVMFSAMRQVSNYHLAEQTLGYLADDVFRNEDFLWIRNLWLPDSPFAPAIPTLKQLAAIPAESWSQAYAALSPQQLAALPAQISFDFSADGCAATIEAIAAYMTSLPSYAEAARTIPQLTGIKVFFIEFSVFAKSNGWLILPLLSFASQVVMTKITQSRNVQAQTQNNKMMTWMMPLFSLFICINYNSSFALYWVASNCFAIIQNLILNHVFSKKEST